jgi:hypothetical protein
VDCEGARSLEDAGVTIRLKKPVRRRIWISGREWTVAITDVGIELRPFRSRKVLLLPWGAALHRAALLEADRIRRERLERRRWRRG